MIASSIPDDGSGLPPVLILLIKGLDHVPHEERHRRLVRVGLEQAGVDLSMAIDGGNHGDSWSDLA